MPVISIIVPVYKVEAYLDRCVKSILDQTFQDFELILVDDGSPDRCGAMCDEWAKRDSRIRVIHKENGGLSDARNVGMDWAFAHGDAPYLTFIDSDDYIHPRMLEVLHRAVTEQGVKVAVSGYAETRGEPLAQGLSLAVKRWEPVEYYTLHCTNATVAWGKLYHRDCFRELRYPKGKIHEDEYVTYKILFACDAIAVAEDALYGYYQNPQGLTKVAWNEKRMDIFGAYEERIDFLVSGGYLELAEDHAMGYIWDVNRQLTAARQLPRKRRGASLKKCRQYMKRAIKKAAGIRHVSYASRCKLYENMYPGLIPVLRPVQWVLFLISVMRCRANAQ